MEAGASHAMPLWRQLSSLLVVLVAMACWAVVPAAADAAVTDAVETTLATVAPPVEKTTENVVGAVQPAVGADVAPAPEVGRAPVENAVAPTTEAAEATIPAAAATAPQVRLNEGPRARVARIAGASSVERLGTRHVLHRQSSHGVARQRPSNERSVSLPGAAPDRASVARTAPDAAATPSRSSAEPGSGSGFGAGGASSDASTGFPFGGALALLVATLLLAGPRLRCQLALLPAVCRPAAFLVVLERPG
jgi:hypothetical protein